MEFSKYPGLLPVFVIIGCPRHHDHSSPWKVKSTKQLFEDQGLQGVESVLDDPQKKALYVTNGPDYIPGKLSLHFYDNTQTHHLGINPLG